MALGKNKWRHYGSMREQTRAVVSFQLNGSSDPPTTGSTAVSGTVAGVTVARSTTGTHLVTLPDPSFGLHAWQVTITPQSTSARQLRGLVSATGGPGCKTVTVLTVSGTTAVDATDGRMVLTLDLDDRDNTP